MGLLFQRQIKDEEGWPDLKQRLEEIPVERLKRLANACGIFSTTDRAAPKDKRKRITRSKLIQAISRLDGETVDKGFHNLWREEGKLPRNE